MRIEPKQLKSALLSFGLAKEKEIEKAKKIAEKTGRDFGEILVNQEVVKREDLIRLQAYILGIPFINLEKEKIPLGVLKIIPQPIARHHNIIAFKKEKNNLEVAMLDPKDLQTIEFIKKKSNLKILPRLTTPESIKNVLSQYEESLRKEFGKIIKKEGEKIPKTLEKVVKSSHQNFGSEGKELPIIRMVDSLLKHAILQKASDIHIEPQEKELLIRYRIDGILRDVMTLPLKTHSGITARIKILSNLKLDEHRLPQDGRFKIVTKDYRFSFRVSVFPTFYGEKVVMRLLPEDSKGVSLEGLGIRGEGLEKVHFNIKRPNGLILVTGPTGCGKTTTLYTIMDILNDPVVNIATIEDPIEYTMPRINQTQVNPKIGLTFANGLRNLLRQDPDIIMVGEIRDNETAALAINAALTGHLVLSTLHTNSAAGSVSRLLDMKVEPFLIASTLKLIIAQRLVRKLCSGLKEYNLKEEEIKNLKKKYNTEKILNILKKEKIIEKEATWQDIKFGKVKTTKACPSGYKGRIGIFEVLEIAEPIKELILKGGSTGKIQKEAEREGMITMLEDGFIKSAQKITSIEEVLRVIRE